MFLSRKKISTFHPFFYWLSTILLCFPSVAFCQFSLPYQVKFKTYTTQDGLADNTITKVVKDKRGFLWVATHNGISRFDGLHFKNYTHVPNDTSSLRSIWVTDFILDANQIPWASTEGGICWYDEKFDRFRYINPPQQIQFIYKGPMCNDAKGVLWVAAENGLKKIDINRKIFENTSLARIPVPESIICTNDGNILIGTRGFGLYLYNPTTNTSKNLLLPGLAKSEHVMWLYKDEEGIWAATSIGLMLIKDETHTALYTIGAGPLAGQKFEQLMCVQSFAPLTGNSKLVCGTYDKNFLLFDKVEKKFIYRWDNETSNPDNVPSGIFYCLYADEKTLWAGTDYGLCKLNLNEQDFVTTPLQAIHVGKTAPLVKKIMPVAQNINLYWMAFGMPYGGLVLYDAFKNKMVKQVHTANSTQNHAEVRTYLNLKTARGGCLYALSSYFLDVVSAQCKGIKSFRLQRQAFSIDEDAERNIWLGTASGIIYLNTKTGKQWVYDCDFNGTELENSSFAEPFRTSGIVCGPDSLVWLTSIKYGLFSFNKKTKIFTPHRQAFNGPYETLNRCSALLPNGKEIWISTMAGLTCYHTQKNTFVNYNSSNGLQSTYVYSLEKDSNSVIWGRGNAGVFSFSPATRRFVNYSLPPTFLGSLIYQLISPIRNGVALGFEGGYSVFALQNMQDVLPKAIITNCKLLNKDFFFDKDSIALQPALFNYEENIIQFQFAAIQFNHPQDVKLHYMLQGIDDGWIPARGNNIASYTNLPAGNYIFKVMAASSNGLQNNIPAIFRFTISPPFWRTWWFMVLAILAVCSLVFFVFKQRVETIKKREAQKTAINKTVAELEMKTLRSRMNPHFIFNSLNSIQKFIWENKKDDASDYLSKFAKLMRLILDHSSHSYISLAEELEALKIYVELEHRRCNGRFEYAIALPTNLDANALQMPPLILQPFVENAIWHGLSPLQKRNGQLLISFELKPGFLMASIKDNGIGRTQAAALKANSSISRSSVGISITQQRLHQLLNQPFAQQLITITDQETNGEPVGTIVSIRIPLINYSP